MLTQRLKALPVPQRPFLSAVAIVLISLFASSVYVYASHISSPTEKTPPPPASGQPQAPQKPTKAGTTATASASSSGLGASLSSFNIQSFQADLFTGSAGAEIPIVVPPGAAGVAPKIVLRYNSGVVDEVGSEQADWTGLGWTLDTGGFIVRDTKGTTDTGDDTFKLVFGGETHDLVSIGSGGYRAKDETFWLINYNSPGDHWTLKTKDGTTHRFGYNADSKATGLTFGPNIEVPVTFRYFIDEITTTSGVSVRYNYFKQSSSYNNKAYDQAVYPDTITYAYRAGALVGPAREVRFIRGSRTDWTDVSGTQHTSYHELSRLDAIEVKVGTSLVRRYNLAYDYSIDRDPSQTWQGGATGDLTLKSVTMLGSDGVSALPALNFTYSGPVLATASNGIGGTVSYSYEQIGPSLFSTCDNWDDERGRCLSSGVSTTFPDDFEPWGPPVFSAF